MTSVDDVVDTLLELEQGDRDWILAQLSAVQRSKLSAQLGRGADVGPVASKPVATAPAALASVAAAPLTRPSAGASHAQPGDMAADADLARLAAAPAAQLSDILRREPAWIVHAVLQAQSRDRAQDVLANLPQGTRSEVARIAHSHVSLTPAVTRFLVRAAAARLRGSDPAIRASRFDRLVDSMRSRLSRRPRLRGHA